MRKIIILIYLLAISGIAFPNGKITSPLKERMNAVKATDKLLVWVFFADKGIQKESALKNALNYIGEKSKLRRAKMLNGNETIDNSDLPLATDYIEVVRKLGFDLRQKSKWFNGISGFAAADKINQIAQLPFVKQIDLVGKYKIPAEKLSEVNLEQPTLNKDVYSFNYGRSFWQLQQINVPAVHDMGYTGKGITIGVFDAGFSNLPHEVFSKMHVIAKWDFVNHGPNVADSTGLMGEGSHGTATLSAIGGFKEGKLIGPAFDADYILAKTENTDSETPVEEDNWIAAMEWADSIGVDVISTSLGYLVFDKPYTSYTWQDMNGRTARITLAAALASRKGIIVCVSAGNEGEDPNHNTLGAPADADSIITVGAVDSTGKKATFSSIGPTSDGRIKPDVMAMGVADYLAGSSSPSSYIRSSGTSFSCPLTAGVAALVLNANPKMTPVLVRDALRNTASGKSNPDNYYGWGIINAQAAVNYALSLITDVNNQKNISLNDYVLYQNYPNPFNPSTNIRYFIPKQSYVRLELYNVLGVKLSTLFEGNKEKGQYSLTLDGSSFASGIYFVRLSAGDFNSTIKVILEK